MDASQLGQSQNEIKSEENAPINVKVCFRFREGFLVVVVFLASSMLTVPSYPSHAHAQAGRQLDGGRSLFQNQAKYKVEQAAGGLCGQGGQGRVEHSVRVSLSILLTHPFVVLV